MEFQIDEPLQAQTPDLDILPDDVVFDEHAEVDFDRSGLATQLLWFISEGEK